MQPMYIERFLVFHCTLCCTQKKKEVHESHDKCVEKNNRNRGEKKMIHKTKTETISTTSKRNNKRE